MNIKKYEIIGLCADKRNDIECFIKAREYYLDEKHKKFVGLVVNGKATYTRILIRKK